MSQKCPRGQIYRDGYTRKAYTRANGTRVKATKVEGGCIEKRGLGTGKREAWAEKEVAKKLAKEAAAKKHYGASSPKCKKGEILRPGTYVEGYTRKAYTRADGTKVKKATIEGHFSPATCVKDTGKAGKGKPVIGPLKKGTLSQYGYATANSAQSRHTSLNKFVREEAKKNKTTQANAALSAYRKLIAVATLQKNTNPKVSKIMRDDATWLKSTHKI